MIAWDKLKAGKDFEILSRMLWISCTPRTRLPLRRLRPRHGVPDPLIAVGCSVLQRAVRQALLLLKIADILQISSLFEAMGRRIEAPMEDVIHR